jgi:hypothetical protein
MRLALVVVGVIAGCAPAKTLRTFNQRGFVWTQPATNLVFVETYRVRDRRQGYLDVPVKSDDSTHWDENRWSEYDHARFAAVDPVTGSTIQLVEQGAENYEELHRASWTPLFWNSRDRILWVEAPYKRIIGYSPTRVIDTKFVAADLPLPFVADPDTGTIMNLASGQQITLGRDRYGAVTVDGNTMRVTRITDEQRDLAAMQTVIDWSGGAPHKLPDVVVKTPPVSESAARVAYGLSANGRWLVEVINAADSGTFIVHDLDKGTIAASLPVPLLPGKPTVYSLGADRFVYAMFRRPEDGDDDDFGGKSAKCLDGASIVASTALVTPLPTGVCVTGVEGTPGRSWLQTRRGSGYIDAEGKLFQLGTTLTHPLVIGPSVIAYKVVTGTTGVDVLTFDFATNTRTTVAHHAPASDTLLNVGPWGATFLAGDRVIIVPPDGAAHTYTLPSPDALQAGGT